MSYNEYEMIQLLPNSYTQFLQVVWPTQGGGGVLALRQQKKSTMDSWEEVAGIKQEVPATSAFTRHQSSSKLHLDYKTLVVLLFMLQSTKHALSPPPFQNCYPEMLLVPYAMSRNEPLRLQSQQEPPAHHPGPRNIMATLWLTGLPHIEVEMSQYVWMWMLKQCLEVKPTTILSMSFTSWSSRALLVVAAQATLREQNYRVSCAPNKQAFCSFFLLAASHVELQSQPVC